MAASGSEAIPIQMESSGRISCSRKYDIQTQLALVRRDECTKASAPLNGPGGVDILIEWTLNSFPPHPAHSTIQNSVRLPNTWVPRPTGSLVRYSVRIWIATPVRSASAAIMNAFDRSPCFARCQYLAPSCRIPSRRGSRARRYAHPSISYSIRFAPLCQGSSGD